MAERARSSRRWRLLTVLGPLLIAGCGGVDFDGSVRMLDKICKPELVDEQPHLAIERACALDGDARWISGPTADTTGVRFGPYYGFLRIKLLALPVTDEPSWSMDALAAAHDHPGTPLHRRLTWGDCGYNCPGEDLEDLVVDVPADPIWLSIVDSAPGVSSLTDLIGDDAILTIGGLSMDLSDLRMPDLDAY